MNIKPSYLLSGGMIEHNLRQGTPEWDAFRMAHYGSSETAAMLGLSPHTSRTDLLDAKTSGLPEAVSKFTEEVIFEKGHELEELARPIVEEIYGIDLYPVTCSRGKLSASCDGLTIGGSPGWEHKQLNKTLAEWVRQDRLPDYYMVQVQHQLLVTSAEKWIFSTSNGTEESMLSMIVYPDEEWFNRIITTLELFDEERKTYVSNAVAELSPAELIIDLPTVLIQASGMITADNTGEFNLALTRRMDEIKTIVWTTDQDFANAKAYAKLFREKAKEVTNASEKMLAGTASIDSALKTLKGWSKLLNETALELEKQVKAKDLEKKRNMAQKAMIEYMNHIASMEISTAPIRLDSLPKPVFADAISGKSKYKSMQHAVDEMLSNAKTNASLFADKIIEKLEWYNEATANYKFLYPDLQVIISKEFEDLKLLVTSRIDKHEKESKEKLELEREKIRVEEEAKAKIKAEKEQAHIAAAAALAVKQEADAKALEESQSNPADVNQGRDPEAVAIEEKRKQAQIAESEKNLPKIYPAGGGGVSHDPFVKILKSELLELEKESILLECLRACGVDNWGGWDDAVAMSENAILELKNAPSDIT